MKNKFLDRGVFETQQKIKYLTQKKRELEEEKVIPMSAAAYTKYRKIKIIDDELLKLKS